ncbi:sterol desaturase family protein [Candidatus Sororendozoicomonas aggregata]|uniref:sterol desaturase family protein n=1 Tax=Candidatus Sororendozoicomonas aggregata TaxID=3073239 RepID=UPI002ED63C14
MNIDINLLLLLLTPVYFVPITIEWWWLKRHPYYNPSARYRLPDVFANLSLGLFYQLGEKLAGAYVMAIYFSLFEFKLFTIAPTLWSFILLLVLQDFCYYWFHRMSHNVRWMWASHVVHHSSQSLNFSTAFRQSFTYPLSGMWLFWIPLVMLGFPPETVLLVVMVNLFYQFFIHSQVVPPLGWIEWVFNTPRHHRVHHAKNPNYIDKNFGGLLIIWDRLFGTFKAESESEPCRYGIPKQVNSYDPLLLTFHEWRDMLKDALKPGKTLKQRLKHLYSYPSWQPKP